MSIVIIGGSAAGIETAIRLKAKVKDEIDVVVIDREKFYVHHPWLVHGFRKGKDIRVNLGFLLSEKRVRFVQSEKIEIDEKNKAVKLDKGREDYTFLVLSLREHPDFGNVKGAGNALKYDNEKDVQKIKAHLRNTLSRAGKSKSREKNLTIAVVGAGRTGISLISELDEFLKKCCDETGVRRIDVKLVLVEQKGSLLPTMPAKAAEHVGDYLSRRGVDIRLGSKVESIKKDGLVTKDRTIPAGTIIWCGGSTTDPMLKGHSIKTDEEGNVIINPYMQSTTDATIYALGNGSSFRDIKYSGGETLGAVVNQAKLLAHNLSTNIKGGDKKMYSHKKTPIWIGLGSKSMMVWGNFVLKGWLAGLLHKIRMNRYLSRWK